MLQQSALAHPKRWSGWFAVCLAPCRVWTGPKRPGRNLGRWTAGLALAGVWWMTTGSAHAKDYLFKGEEPGDAHSWEDARNWVPEGVPGAADNATIGFNLFVHAGAVTVANLTLDRGTLTSSGLTVTGTFAWSGGRLNGNGNITLPRNATLNISDHDPVNGDIKVLMGQTLDIQGGATVNWTGKGGLYAGDGAIINNSGIFAAQGNASFKKNTGAAPYFQNLPGGTVQKTGGGGSTSFRLPFDNRGTVDAQSGSIEFFDAGTSTGAFHTSLGGRINFGGGTHTLLYPAAITGEGDTEVDGGSGDGSATLTIPGGVKVAATNFAMVRGKLNGAGILNISRSFRWAGGTLDGEAAATNPFGTTNIEAGAHFVIDGSDSKILRLRTLNNDTKEALWAGGDIVVEVGGEFNNLKTFQINCNARCGPHGTFNNTGTVTKTGTRDRTEFTDFTLTFNNSGLVDLPSGTIRLGEGISTGEFKADFPGQISFVLGIHTLLTGAKITGPGYTVVQSPGTLRLPAAVTIPAMNFQLDGGTLNGAGTLNISHSFLWFGGTLDGDADIAGNSGVTHIAAGASFILFGHYAGENGLVLSRRTINNDGSAEWTASDIHVLNGAVFNNSGTFTAWADRTFGTAGTFNNLAGGTVLKDDSRGLTDFHLTNFTNRGTVTALTGRLNFFQYTQTAGNINLNAGNISSDNPFAIQGGTIAGTGSIMDDAFNSGGHVGPGHSPGSLTVTGSYVQGGGGALDLQVGGPSAGSGFDQLNVSGSATLDGALNLSLINGYLPARGTAFKVLTYGAHSGRFATVVSPPLPGGRYFIVRYNAHDATIITALDSVPPSLLSFTTPAAGERLTRLPAITGRAVDNAGGSGIQRVDLRLQRRQDGRYWTGATWGALTDLPTIVNTVAGTWTAVTAQSGTPYHLPRPSELVPGTYTLQVSGFDLAANRAGAAVTITVPTSPVPTSPVAQGAPTQSGRFAAAAIQLSSATVSAIHSSVTLTFTGPLDAAVATDAGRYRVTVSGHVTTVLEATYNSISRSVTLTLPAGHIRAGDHVVTAWQDLSDSQGRALAGQTPTLTAP